MSQNLTQPEEIDCILMAMAGRDGQDGAQIPDWAPSVDISETDAAYLIKGEIPGMRKESNIQSAY